MKKRLPILLMAGALGLAGACGPDEEIPPEDWTDAGVDAETGPVVDVPDSIAFQILAADGDTTVTREEFVAWMRDRVPMEGWQTDADSALTRQEFAEVIHVTWDTDRDRGLDPSEWERGVRYFYPEDLDPGVFEEWDMDDDDRLDPEELIEGLDTTNWNRGWAVDREAMMETGEAAEMLFRLWDVDGDGQMDMAEYNAGIAYWWL